MKRVLAACLLVATGAAVAQSTEPSKAPERPPLKLRLDEADLRSLNSQQREPAPTKEAESTLPSLGGEARRIEPSRPQTRSSPYPPDAETWRRQ